MSEALPAWFTIIDDTDHATLELVKPVYDLLKKLGLRTTKTVWPLRCDDPHHPYADGSTLQDKGYATWIRDLQGDGFEIAFHGASGQSNLREKTLRGLELFDRVVGRLPTLHVNHTGNRDCLYWRTARFDSPVVRRVVGLSRARSEARYDGHDPSSPYFWGDIAEQTIRYCRNLTFVREIDLRRVNPTIPYADPRRPMVPRWFSSCDGGTPRRFTELLSQRNLVKLEAALGVCIVYTHFGAGFVKAGRVLPEAERALRMVAEMRSARFVPATELLDGLCTDRAGLDAPVPVLPRRERARMEWSWLGQKILSGGRS